MRSCCLLFFFLLGPQAMGHPLVDWTDSILHDVMQSQWSRNCVPYLVQLQKKINEMDRQKPKREELKQLAEPLLANFWKIRLALHDQVKTSDDACVTEIRNTTRLFRFLEDFLAEIQQNVDGVDPASLKFDQQKTPIDEMAQGYFTQKVNQLNIQPGDVIIARGVSFLSAMVARLGDVDSQFSHVILVSENPETKAIETVESYVGKGVGIYSRVEALRNENARLLVLRPVDQGLASRASSQMRTMVKAHQGQNRIQYDYALDFQNHDTMSCAEVSQVAFLNASQGAFQLPERPSFLTHGKDLLKNLGVKEGKTFTPGDLEMDSRFEVVGEWRDLRLTRDSRLKDSILTKILEWMDKDGYALHHSFKSNLAKGLIWGARRTPFWPLFKMIGIDDFSEEIPRSMVGTVALLNELANGMLIELKAADRKHEVKTGLSMTYLELYVELEAMRLADKTRENPVISKYLR